MPDTDTLEAPTQVAPPEEQRAESQTPPAPEGESAPPPAPQEEPEFEDGAAYLESLKAGKDGQDEAPKPARPASPIDDPRATQYRETLRNRTAQRQEHVKGPLLEKLTRRGLDEADAREIVTEFGDLLNGQNSDGVQLAGYEAAALAVAHEQDTILEGFRSGLTPAQLKVLNAQLTEEQEKRKGPVPYAEAFKLREAALGYVSRKDHEEALVLAFNKGRAKGEKTASSGTSKPLGVAGSSASGSEPKNLKEAEEMHAGMHPSGRKITNAEMRTYQARFGG